MATPRTVLVTGATGYIGGRLVPRLLEAGFRVRCLARDPARLQGRPWLSQVEVAAGDCLRAETLPAAMQGIEVVFYLVHSMAGGGGFQPRGGGAAWATPTPPSPNICVRARKPAPCCAKPACR